MAPWIDRALALSALVIGLAAHVAAGTDPGVEAAPIGVGSAIGAVLGASLLLLRRSRPGLALVGLFVVALLFAGDGDRGFALVQLLFEGVVLCFAIGGWSPRPRVAGSLLAVLIGVLVVGALADGASIGSALAAPLAVVALPAVAGAALRERRRYLDAVVARLAAVEQSRDEQARRAVEQERSRIAREMHDVVAHHVSLIGVQAGAARVVLDRDPDRTRAALAEIEASSRAAVGEMRRLLSALQPHDGSGAADLTPQPALTDLDDLAERLRRAGYDVALTIEGSTVGLPAALSLTCFRIIEESLTNVMRHSDARSVTITVTFAADAVVVCVTDPGPRRSTGGSAGGHGLVGMRERVGLFGGVLVAGPLADGFRVEAHLPLRMAP